MPKRLSDITHAYERSAADLEAAQDELTGLVEAARSRVEVTGKAHRTVSCELAAYLRAHQDEVVIANNFGYHFDPHCPGSIRRRPVFWAHHVWIEDPPEFDHVTYRVPVYAALPALDTDRNEGPDAVARVNALSAAWAMGSEDPEETAP